MILVLKLLAFGCACATGAWAENLTVLAAASLKNALEDIAAKQETDVTFSFAGSGTLARQVAAGAPADVVVLASSDWMDWIESKTPLTQRRDIVGNRLVLVGPNDAQHMTAITAQTLQTRLGDGRLALGQTDSVPAGIYAKAWLTTTGLWETLKPQLAETDNVRAALALVSRGETPLGVVYNSDALADTSVTVLYDIPTNQHPEIRYPAAATTPAGEAFVTFLSSQTAHAIFAEQGFIPAVRAPE